MKGFICDICNGNDIIKDGEDFVCKGCGVHYSVDAVKNKIAGTNGSINESTTSDIGSSGSANDIPDFSSMLSTEEQIDNLRSRARNAAAMNELNNAARLYNKIASLAPDDWEGQFYSKYYGTLCNFFPSNIGAYSSTISNCQKQVLQIIKDNVDASEQANCCNEVRKKVVALRTLFIREAEKTIGRNNSAIHKNVAENLIAPAVNMTVNLGDAFCNVLEDFDTAEELYNDSWKVYRKSIEETGAGAGVRQHIILSNNNNKRLRTKYNYDHLSQEEKDAILKENMLRAEQIRAEEEKAEEARRLEQQKAQEDARLAAEKAEEERLIAQKKAEEERAEKKKKNKKKLKIAAIVIACLLVIVAAVVSFILFAMPAINYNRAVTMKNDGDYNGAGSVFEKLGDYKDTEKLLNECEYEIGLAEYGEGNYEAALEAFSKAGGISDADAYITKCTVISYSDANAGDTVTFGSYEQDNDEATNDESIEWTVLDNKNGKLTLISNSILDSAAFDDNSAEWKDSEIRKWLNNDFMKIAFSEDEISLIKAENDTKDKIELITVEQFNAFKKYFTTNGIPTEYAQSIMFTSNGGAAWWTSTPAEKNKNSIITVTASGILYETGLKTSAEIGIRPVITIDTNIS